MKVLAINGSPNKEGNTYHALTIIGSKLQEQGIDFEILHIGNKAIRGCLACGKCRQNADEKCSITTDPVNEYIQKMKEADGLIFGSPVHFAGVPGTMKSLLDRAFYVAGSNGGMFRHKVGASVVAVRRTGGSATFDCLNHYITYSEMLMATANYWNVIHGRIPGEVVKDEEGVQIMEVLASNMAWLLKMKQQTCATIPAPESVQKVMTSFVR
ncbi:MAG TPA: flavodoxin family protein [Bacteroidales bacterium]|nr:flavodoxin family protein [Bacteroidales bacterium]